MSSKQLDRVWWTLRIGAAACFIGHGAFGLITKREWLPYFAVFGIDADTALGLMPVIGTVDILMGLIVLFRPSPAALLYMTVWALWTAMLRPVTGDRFAELLERAGNYGVPFALLLMVEWPRSLREWFGTARRRVLDERRTHGLAVALTATAVTLIVGHAVLGLQGKELLGLHYTAIGFANGASVATIVGQFEVGLAAALLVFPTAALAALVAGWKLATESLFLTAGAPVWEFIERGGSYAAPIALLALSRIYRLPRLALARIAARVPHATVIALMVGILVAPNAMQAQQSVPKPDDSTLVALLRKGGIAVACRHSITDHANEDRMPIDYANRAAQRNLSADGEAQARALGEALRGIGVRIGEVFANPLFRTRETATLAFAKVVAVDSLGDGTGGVLKRMLSRPVTDSTARVIVTRNGMLSGAFRGMGLGMFAEGDCGIVEPQDSSFRAVAKLSPKDFARLAEKKD